LSQTISAAPATPKQYLFVDAVRFWSMLGVVSLHANIMLGAKPVEGVIPYAVDCLVKYGTIGFFLISGFLLGDRMATSAALPYLSRRLRILLAPWAFWFGLLLIYLLAGDVAHQRITTSSAASWRHMLQTDLNLAAFSSAFWFVPNLAIGMCTLMLFRRYLYSVKLGAILFAVNFLYVANIYGEWFSPKHTSALFAFVSYLWLGSFAARNFARLSRFIDRVPMVAIGALAVLSYLASVAEVRILVARHSSDPLNTLRLSNQIFSVLVVLLLFKLKSVSWPSFVNVRQQTYSIYLLHTFMLRIGLVALDHGLRPGFVDDAGLAMKFLLRAALFVFAYGGSLLLGNWIATFDAWRWTIGLKPREYQAPTNKISTSSKAPIFGFKVRPLTK